ncbi:hypothetical protein AB0I49_37565 [Streptomyces sp. NPDC050617]|uniref:DUF7848 domain-containing protein n=1 Tax=Streptomyces sp. NPDC050617 TaxID=3154628 RepID=UPI00343955E0
MSRIYRYVPWSIVQDPATYPEYRADCVTGEDKDCGEMIRAGGPDWVEEWMRRHTQDTGHRDYRRTVTNCALLEPSDELRGRLVIGEAASPRPAPVLPSGILGRNDG